MEKKKKLNSVELENMKEKYIAIGVLGGIIVAILIMAVFMFIGMPVAQEDQVLPEPPQVSVSQPQEPYVKEKIAEKSVGMSWTTPQKMSETFIVATLKLALGRQPKRRGASEQCTTENLRPFDDEGEYVPKDSLSLECTLQLFSVGEYYDGTSTRDVYLSQLELQNYLGPFHSIDYVLWDKEVQKFIPLVQPEQIEYVEKQSYYGEPIAYTFSELEPAKKLDLRIPEGTLYFAEYKDPGKNSLRLMSTQTQMYAIMDTESGEIIPGPTGEIIGQDSRHGDIYYVDGYYEIVLPNGAVARYDLVPYFMKAEQEARVISAYDDHFTVDITWNNPEKHPKTEQYELAGEIVNGACAAGILSCTNIVNGESWFLERDLIQIGKTIQGDPIYELKYKDSNPYYTDMFEFGHAAASFLYDDAIDPERKEMEAKKAFLEEEPIFFWEDSRGNWRVYKKAKYTTLAECGKPVIYLYPEEDMDINVQVEPNGGFSKVIPEYPQEGWTVHAKTTGELYNYADETSYPYLFWEGFGYDYQMPKQGFVMAARDVPARMDTLLARTGLNAQERTDFMEYWEEKLMASPYVFVTFLEQEKFDEIAPLSVSPAPDTTIRVFMDYVPLDSPISVEPLEIKTPERNGFTVVEWGGALH